MPTRSTPDDHFTASPHCRVKASVHGVLWSCWWRPNYRCRDYIFRRCSNSLKADKKSSPDDHFTASPHCCVILSASGRVGRAGGHPTIRAGIVSPAGVQLAASSSSTPDDHFTASPHCRVKRPGHRARWSCWWPSNYPCRDYIFRRCSNSLHPDHDQIRPRRSFHCQSTLLCETARSVGALVVLVAIQLSVLGLYLPPVFK